MDTHTARALFAADRFAALSGIEIVEAGPGWCTTRLVIEDKHLNAANVVQGGAIFTLADLPLPWPRTAAANWPWPST